MTVLVDVDQNVAPFRPPPVEALSDEQQRLLQTRLSGAVESWAGALSIGLRVARVSREPTAREAGALQADLWYHTGGASVAVGLTGICAASLLCVNLGGPAPDDARPSFTEIDLALLDAWAQRSLSQVARALDADAPVSVSRGGGLPDDLADEAIIVAELTFAADRPAGVVVLDPELTPQHRGEPSARLADYPEHLLSAAIRADAIITTEPVPIRDLLQLEPGDVLLVGDQDEIRAQVRAGGSTMAAGRPGARADLRAVRITGGAARDDEDAPRETADGL